MAPSPIPAPLPPWAKALIQLAPLIPTLFQELLDHIGVMDPGDTATPGTWRQAHIIWGDSGNANPPDRMITTLDIANITGGAIDSSWTDADYNNVNNELNGMIAGWCTGFAQGRLKHLQTNYYVRAFNPYSNPKPFAVSGPPEKIFLGTSVGAGVVGGIQANQISYTTTERTAYPRHWGRMYWPLPVNTTLSLQGGITTASVDALCTLVHQTYANFMADEFFPVVPVTQVQKQPVRGLLTMESIQVDNVPDVIRRRRLADVGYRKVLGL